MLDQSAPDQMLHWRGVQYRIALPPRASGGALSIMECIMPPRMGPPMHIHHAEDEIFYILSGELEFSLDGQRIRKGPGETAFVPRGVVHTFTVTGEAPCRHLVILTPSGFEGYFEEMAARQLEVPRDLALIEEASMRHNCEVVGPPIEATL